jgi:hypothetical protein
MQDGRSHTGISAAMLRFSQRLVPTLQVPSTGKALTGSRSPLLAIMTAVTPWTKSGASGETAGGRRREDVTPAGAGAAESAASAWSTASKLRFRTSPPFFPYVSSIVSLIFAIAVPIGSTPVIEKKQVCMIVLMRPFRPISRARR